MCVGGILIMCFGMGPRWVIKKRKREYATVIKAPPPVSTIVSSVHLNRAEIITSSAMKLGRGGSPRLARHAKNHHVPIRGINIWSPRARSIVRVWVRS